MTVDAKPAKRIRDPQLVRNFSMRAANCAVCGANRQAGLQAHHVLNRSQSGDDATANLVALCLRCHTAYHDADADTRRRLGEHLCCERPDTLNYLAHKLGATQSVSFVERSYGG